MATTTLTTKRYECSFIHRRRGAPAPVAPLPRALTLIVFLPALLMAASLDRESVATSKINDGGAPADFCTNVDSFASCDKGPRANEHRCARLDDDGSSSCSLAGSVETTVVEGGDDIPEVEEKRSTFGAQQRYEGEEGDDDEYYEDGDDEYYEDGDDEYYEDGDDEDYDEEEDEIVCEDWRKGCKGRVQRNECETNPEFMLQRCPSSCGICDLMERSVGYGAKQEVLFGDARESLSSIEQLRKANEYMFQPEYDSVRDKCANQDRLCTFWAAVGVCVDDKDFMIANCAPACQFCHLLDELCPDPEPTEAAVQVGYWERVFDRLLTDPEFAKYQPVIVSRPGSYDNADDDIDVDDSLGKDQLPDSEAMAREDGDVADEKDEDKDDDDSFIEAPWVAVFESFLTEEECNHLIRIGTDMGYDSSLELAPNDEDGTIEENAPDSRRTSTNTFLDYREDSVAERIMERIEQVTGIPRQNSEEFQLVHYEEGQYYQLHHDCGGFDFRGPCGPRVLTFFLYLNDVAEGGGTRFPDVFGPDEDEDGLVVIPKMGRAVMWTNVMDVDDTFPREEGTFHEALPVIEGQKFGANVWLHLYDWQSNGDKGCVCE